MSSFDPATDAAEVTALVQAASDRALDWFRSGRRHEQGAVGDKGGVSGFDPVTEADRAVEADLRERLESRFPDHAILGEEFGESGSGPCRWTIDPIDGTRAFITGQPMWGTLLGLQIDGAPVAGWMHIPVLGETYVGHDACRFIAGSQTRTVRVSDTTAMADAIVMCTHPDMFADGDQADAFGRVATSAKMVRYSGDCLNYGLLAMGLADSVIENGLQPYDIIPLIPIVRAAGGIVTDLDGNTPIDGGYVVASATEALHRETLAMLQP